MLVTFIPFTETLTVFHELIKPPRLLACQQKVPAPSKVKGIVMVDVTGLHAPTPVVGVLVMMGGVVGVNVRLGVSEGPVVGVLVRVGVNPGVGVKVRVGVAVIVPGVKVRVGEAPTVLVGVFVITGVPGVLVRVGVNVATGGPFLAAM